MHCHFAAEARRVQDRLPPSVRFGNSSLVNKLLWTQNDTVKYNGTRACVIALNYKSVYQLMEEQPIVDWSQVHVGDVLMLHSNYMVTPTRPEGVQLKPLLYGWILNETRCPNLHVESLNDQSIQRLFVDGAFDPVDFRLPTLTGSIRVRQITRLWILFDTFNTTTHDEVSMSYKNFVLDRPQFAREFFEQQAWTCYKQSSAHMAPVDAIGSSNPYMIHYIYS